MTTELTAEETKFFESGGAEVPQETAEAPAPAPAPAVAQPVPAPAAESTVPLAALHEERNQRKALQKELADYRQKMERMEQTFQQVLDKANAQPVPKYEEDPLGYLQHTQQEVSKTLKNVDEKVSKFEQQTVEQQNMQQLAMKITSAEAEFRGKAADYDAAVKYLKEVRKQDMLDLGVPAEHVDQLLTREIISFSQAALSNGKNPAESAYNMAKRYGYRPTAAQATQQQSNLQAIAAGMEASKTVQGGSSGGVRLQDLAQMDEASLDAIIKDDKKWTALVRGRTIQ